MEAKYCRYCHNEFINPRPDSVYCSDTCKARYDRMYGQNKGYMHEQKERWVACECEECGGTFWVNEYAVRGGQRRARFCSTNCRVTFFRNKSKGNWGETYHGHTTHEKARNTPPPSSSKKQSSPPPPPPPPPPPKDNTYYYTSREGYAKAYEFLNLRVGESYVVSKRAYLKLIKMYHPDTCKDANSTRMSQAINAAWEAVKTHLGH